jgi:hypothetical protein
MNFGMAPICSMHVSAGLKYKAETMYNNTPRQN